MKALGFVSRTTRTAWGHISRASPWARAWRNPDLPNTNYHFRTKNGHRIKGWKAVYLADLAHPDVDAWVEQMWREGAAQLLVHTVDVRVPNEAACVDAEHQVLLEALRVREVLTERPSYSTLPMVRGACDSIIPCPWQYVCYNESVVDPATLGLYARREPLYSISGGRDEQRR